MLRSIYFFASTFLLLILFSCSGGNSDKEKNPNAVDSAKIVANTSDNSFEKGKVISSVPCAKEPALSYALYLPGNYSADKKFPVIYFFDSHGSGTFPLEKYKELGEKYGYILAGSNNSKNGMMWEQNRNQIKIFREDVEQRLSIDHKRIYACGFSGGSRVAASVAIFDGGINCVIGMGAGLPNLTEPIHNRFDYIGFAGSGDFNMNEMIALTTNMDKSPIRHQLILFDGKHEWAPAENVEDAFLWIEFNAMKDGLITKNDSVIKGFVIKDENEIKDLEKKKNAYDLLLQYKKMINYLDGLTNVLAYRKQAEDLSKSDELKKFMARRESQGKEELSLQEKYRKDFVTRDFAWWNNEIKRLEQISKNKNDETKAQMSRRMLSYLSLVAYMNASSALQSKQLDAAEAFLNVYQTVDSENPEHQYLFADLYGIKKDNSKAISSLKNAVKLGFNDLSRMESDPSLASLKGTLDYNTLVQEIKSK